jgi:SagB-type dehydrogenase family enzyme
VSLTRVPTVTVAEQVYGDGVALDDPAETYHEASRLSPNAAATQPPGLLLLLEGDRVMHASVTRATRRHPHRPSLELPSPRLPCAALGAALRRRRSGLGAWRRELSLRHLSTLLACGYGSHRRDGAERRRIPSGGALYPLEVYVLPLAVQGLAGSVCHYDPYRHRLELLRGLDTPEDALAAALVDPALATTASAALVITAVFWRTRFKYGQRGYRFALLEAGHLAQNVVLVAAALELPSLPVGGFYDRAVEKLVGVDGVDESAIYVLLVGGGGS